MKMGRWLGGALVLGGACLAALGCRSGPERSDAGSGDTSLVQGRGAALAEQTSQAPGLGRAEQLNVLRERALGLLIELVASEDPQTRVHAIEALIPAPRRLDAVIGARLNDENLGVRSVACVAVGRAGLDGHEGALRGLLRDESPYVRASAVYALRATGVDVNPTPLATLLLSDPSIRVRAYTAFLLGELGEASARSLLREARLAVPARASPEQARLFYLQIAEALVKLGDERAIEGIRGALYPSRPEELEATALAVQIIGELSDKASVDALIYLTAAKDRENNLQPEEIRLAAAAAAARMGRPQGAFIADDNARSPNDGLRAQAADVYGWTHEIERLPILEAMLDDPSDRVRVAAAESIVRIVDAQGL